MTLDSMGDYHLLYFDDAWVLHQSKHRYLA